MYVWSNKTLLMHIYPKKARFRAVWASFEKLALENTYFGCVAALPIPGHTSHRVRTIHTRISSGTRTKAIASSCFRSVTSFLTPGRRPVAFTCRGETLPAALNSIDTFRTRRRFRQRSGCRCWDGWRSSCNWMGPGECKTADIRSSSKSATQKLNLDSDYCTSSDAAVYEVWFFMILNTPLCVPFCDPVAGT
jgi:hypothetical protein